MVGTPYENCYWGLAYDDDDDGDGNGDGGEDSKATLVTNQGKGASDDLYKQTDKHTQTHSIS